LSPFDTLPGIELSILGVRASTTTAGNLGVGARPVVTFSITKSDHTAWELSEMSSASIILSGPTSNYQLVIASPTDILTASVRNQDGSYSYELPMVPALYPPPLNDSGAFDADDGELQGTALRDGTYTVGLAVYRNYDVEGRVVREASSAVFDVLLGNASTLAPRQVVTAANCNQCHRQLEAHGGTRNDLRQCVLCHTAGAEDKNVPAAAGGTPGVTIDFGVLMHKLHSGVHLPSVVGVGTDAIGARDYGRGPSPLLYAGYQDRVFDFSKVGFPVMPSAYVSSLLSQDGTTYTGTGGNGPMPRDEGYSALSPDNKRKEDVVRSGVVECAKCHGDPDGPGPLAAPLQGDRSLSVPTRKACGSCHDDIDWTRPYTANGQTMPPQTDDTLCTVCHAVNTSLFPMTRSHLHPTKEFALNRGLDITLTGVTAGASGSLESGAPIAVSFSVTNDATVAISLHDVTRFQFMVVGPSENPQVVTPTVIPFDTAFRKSAAFSGNGTASKPRFGAGAVAQTLSVAFNSATDLVVLGSTTAAQSFTLAAAAGSTVNVTYAGLTFTITQGSTPFASGDRFYFEAIPVAASYTMNLPFDVSLEAVGRATGGADTLGVGNAPLLWGRQTVFERTAAVGSNRLNAAARAMDRLVVTDSASAGLAVGDRVVLDDGLPTEEYLQVGRLQVTDDWMPIFDLASDDRVYFTTALRFAHAAGATIQKATLTARREGVHYTVSDPTAGTISLAPGAFANGAPVIVSYRTDARFGWKRSPSDAVQRVFQPAAADSAEIGENAGDWVGMPIVPGTYQLGAWGHVDFSVTPAHMLAGVTRAWDDITTDDTTYRGISSPATLSFLYGGASTLTRRNIVSSEACDTCHDSIQAHGNGRKGLETCLVCHATSGMEDGPKFTFASWYVPPTPGVTMDFRSLIHKVHSGRELAKKDEFAMIGVFLGKPYVVTLEDKGYSAMPGGVKDCASCHVGDSWKTPSERRHPSQRTPVRTWTNACNGCHDSDAAGAHMERETANGTEACAICHGPNDALSVEHTHKVW